MKNDIANKIKDKGLRLLFIDFRKNAINISAIDELKIKRYLSCLIRLLKNRRVRDLSWGMVCQISNNESLCFNERRDSIKSLLFFLLFLDIKGNYVGTYKKQFNKNSDSILILINSNYFVQMSSFDLHNTCPSSIVVWESRSKKYAFVVQSRNQFLLEIFQQYLNETTVIDKQRICNTIRFFSYFEEAIYPHRINNLSDLNDEIFFELVRNVSKSKNGVHENIGSRVIVFFQWLMTIVPEEIRKTNFQLTNSPLLTYTYVVKKIVDGYHVIKYNQYEEPKYFDRMILIPSSDDMHLKGDSYRVFPIDVSTINNSKLKKWYINYFWKTTSVALKFRTKNFISILHFLTKIDKKIQKDETEITINESDIAEYISKYKSSNMSDFKVSFKLQQLKKFLQFIESEYSHIVNPICYRMLVFREGKSKSFTTAYQPNNIKRIIEHLKVDKPLIACAISIISNSELRTASVMNLKIDCLERTMSKKGHEEYSVKVHTKNSDNEIEIININKYVKSYIEEALELTKDIRKFATSYEKDYIFIFQPEGRTMPRRFKPDAFTNAINRACEKIGVQSLGTKGLRNNYMQAASNYLTKNNLPNKLIKSITGHSEQVHHESYDQINITDFFEQYFNLSIGNVYLKGTITSKTNLGDKSSVVENCGFCSEDHCQLDGKVDCFLCKNFVTTLSCIPFFEKAIHEIDNRIIRQSIAHEKDFLLSKKKLLVGYLVKLYELKEGVRNEN